MLDLSTTYLGLKPQTARAVGVAAVEVADTLKRLEDHGAAPVLYSLFEEQIEHESNELDFTEPGAESMPKRFHTFPIWATTISARTNTWSISARPKRRWTSRSSPA
jgi:dihydroorotate dehydrogenase (fumarate)